MKKYKTLAVSATALRSGGGSVILKQFIDSFPTDGSLRCVIFVPYCFENSSCNNPHLIIKKVDIESLWKRIAWDSFFFFRESSKYIDSIDCVLSLQNTTVKVPKNVQQLVYLHQGIFLTNEKWSFFNRRERRLAIWKKVYPLFVFLYKTNAKFCVQTEWMSESLKSKYNVDTALVIKPSIDAFVEKKTGVSKKEYLDKLFFYPCTDLPYKNLELLLRIATNLKLQNSQNISIVLTLSLNSNFAQRVFENKLEKYFSFVGSLNQNQVCDFYYNSHVVLYPSKIESFGLPLLEAAVFGKKIICADLPYAREVLGEYAGAIFLHPDKDCKWTDEILSELSSDPSEFKVIDSYSDSWPTLYKYIGEI
ncbi:glycosyltransferase [Pseudoalteromonas neustonica]|nr:glycosyltransferase [Pseudoalteromonas neustonica]